MPEQLTDRMLAVAALRIYSPARKKLAKALLDMDQMFATRITPRKAAVLQPRDLSIDSAFPY